MKNNNEKKWEQFLWNYHLKIVPTNIDNDYKGFELHFYLEIEPENKKYKNMFNDREHKDVVELFNECHNEFRSKEELKSSEESQSSCIRFLELFEEYKEGSITETIELMKTIHSLFVTWKNKSKIDFKQFLKRSKELKINKFDFEEALKLFEDWKDNIIKKEAKEGTLNDYIDHI